MRAIGLSTLVLCACGSAWAGNNFSLNMKTFSVGGSLDDLNDSSWGQQLELKQLIANHYYYKGAVAKYPNTSNVGALYGYSLKLGYQAKIIDQLKGFAELSAVGKPNSSNHKTYLMGYNLGVKYRWSRLVPSLELENFGLKDRSDNGRSTVKLGMMVSITDQLAVGAKVKKNINTGSSGAEAALQIGF